MILRHRSRDAFVVYDSQGTTLAIIPLEGDPTLAREGERGKPLEEAKVIARAIAGKLGVSARMP